MNSGISSIEDAIHATANPQLELGAPGYARIAQETAEEHDQVGD
jgi:hypothetical protein